MADGAGPGLLAGRTVVVTRATSQASSLVEALTARGAEVVAVPVIAVEEAADGGAALRTAVADLAGSGTWDWLIVTSTNGADRVGPLVAPGALPAAGVRVAAIGPGTADALARHGIATDLVPDRFVAEGLLAAFPAPPSGGGRVLLAQAAGARRVLRDGLAAAGWDVVAVEAYRTVHPSPPADVVDRARRADVITFTSASTVTGFVAAVGIDAVPPVVASIGPITSDAARAVGIDVSIEADPHTIPGLVDALVAHLAPPSPPVP